MKTADFLNLMGFVFGLVAFLITFWFNRRIANQISVRSDAMDHYNRVAGYTSNLFQHPSALSIHGVSMTDLERDGISADQMAYFMQYLLAIDTKNQYSSSTMYEHIIDCAYCQNIFDQEVSRKCWKYARHMVGGPIISDLDRYLCEKYGDSEISD